MRNTSSYIWNFNSKNNIALERYPVACCGEYSFNNLLLEEDLGGVSAISYINTLIKVLFTKEQQHLAYVQIKEKGKGEDEYKNSEVINYNPNKERIHKHDYTMGIPTLEGYNFIYRDGSLEYLTKRKAHKVIEDSMNIDIDVLSNKGGSLWII